MSLRIASIRMKRRPLLAAAVLAPFAGALARVPAASAQDPIVVTMVTDTAGIGDQNFNDLAKRGLDRAVGGARRPGRGASRAATRPHTCRT